jgi:general secretion pathway protein H
MQQLYASSQYRGAVNDVLSSLSMTRQEAIRSGVAVDVGFNPVERRIVRGSKTIELPDSLEMEVLAARELNRGDLGVIRFYPDGGASGGHVRLTHERGMSTQLTVDWLLGTVALCQSDCPDAL